MNDSNEQKEKKSNSEKNEKKSEDIKNNLDIIDKALHNMEEEKEGPQKHSDYTRYDRYLETLKSLDTGAKMSEDQYQKKQKKEESKKIEKEEKSETTENITRLKKYYDDLLNTIINTWEFNQENFLNYYSSINSNINNMLSVPCIVANKNNVLLIFNFLCNFINFLKDKLKTIPIMVLTFLYNLNENEIFARNPTNLNTVSPFNSNYDIIEDKLFYEAFKQFLPDKEVVNHQFPISNNCMYKYFTEFLFHSGFNQNFLNDFLSRDDLDFTHYTYFSHHAFLMLINCSQDFIQKNNYNITLIKNFTNKIGGYLSNSENLLKQNKALYLQLIKAIYDKFTNEIFGGIAYMSEKIEKNNLDEDYEKFCFTLFKPCEILLKQQKLELRIVAMDHLSNIVNQVELEKSFYNISFNDCEKVLEYTKKKLLKFIQGINIYELIFGENIHEAIIERSYKLLSFLYKNNIFTAQQISDLWKLSLSKYQTISNSIISLFGKLLPDFSNEDCDTILQIVSNMNYNEINEVTLKLLENFFKSNQRHEKLLNILYKYSNELSYYEGLSNTIINKSRKILINLLFNKMYSDDLHQCIKNCLFCLDNNYLLNTHRTIFSEIMKDFIIKEKSENTKDIFKLIDMNINDFQMLVIYLEQKYSMERILMNHFLFMKKFFIFLVDESIKFKQLINEGHFDFNSLVNIDKLISDYKKYENCENKMDIDNEIKEMNNIDFNDSKYLLLPKSNKDIENYLKIILNDFIDYFKNKLLKEKIILSNEDIANNIFTQFEFSFEKNTYQKIANKFINNILTIHHMGNIHFNRTLLDFFYQLFVENSIFNGEKDIFFTFIKNILIFQTNNFYLNLLSDKDMEYLYIEKIVSNNVLSLPFSAYEAFNIYMIYINQKNGNIIYSKENNKYIDIKNIKLFIGLKTLIEFHAISKEYKLVTDSLMTLNNILELGASDKINRAYLLDELFALLEVYKNKLKESQNNIIEKTAIKRILRLISNINKTKVTKNLLDKDDPNNIINLYIKNNFYFTNSDQDIPLQVFKGLTIREFKNVLIENILCINQYNVTVFNSIKNYEHQDILTLDQLKDEIRRKNLILLFCSPKILKDEYTLAEYNIQSGNEIIILNGASTSINNEANFSMTEAQLKDAFSQIKVVFQDKYSEEIMKEALYKNKGVVENTIVYMTEADNIARLINEIEEKKKNEPKKSEEIICLEENKFNYLLNILNEGDSSINTSIWTLLDEIKFQDDFITNCIGEKFDKIFEEENLNKKKLILKIINSIIFEDKSFCKYNKLNKISKNKWIDKFIQNENFISNFFKRLTEIKIDENNEINISGIILIIINWFLNIFHKISDLNKNKLNQMNQMTDEESESNYNILEENKIEQKQKHNEMKKNNINEIIREDDFGEYDINETQVNNFIQTLEKNKFIIVLYNILNLVDFFSVIQTKFEKRKIIKNVYNIIIEYIQIKPKEVQCLLDEEKTKRKIVNILLLSKDSDLRKSSMNFIKELLDKIKIKNNEANIKEEDKIDVQSQLLKYYFNDLISEEVYFEEFYELYNYLINFDTVKPQTIPIDQIIDKLLDYLYFFYINSKKNGISKDNKIDKENTEKINNKLKYNLYILNCFYPFYSQLLQNEIEKKYSENKDIILILYNSLFEKEQNLIYLFTDEQLRLNAFNFLLTLISLKEEYFNIILPKIILQHRNIPIKKAGLPVDYPLRNLQKQKFIGLKNFGATCYLNSLLQQMYMIPTFKHDLFQFNITTDKLDESTIYNMQLTFFNLKQSFFQFYPPMKFINSFKKAFNGEPIHVGIQQDTDEFLAILCDKLEEEAKIFNQQNFLENSFKGGISNEILSLEKDYKYYSQITEPFYRITLDIKGHKNLEEALDAYIKGEILDGENKYYCSDYDKKISVKKRTSIKFMGNEIIIHLKRFEFDFITFENSKLNDYIKFPLELNLKKWTRAYIRLNELEKELGKNNFNVNDVITEREKENLNDEKMNFELTGILVHSGTTIQNGHYYSIIKDQESNLWYKFNDNVITEFDIEKDLEKECFGNIESKKNQFGKGAYLLFYTRKECVKKYQNFETKINVNENLLKSVKEENIDFIDIKTYNSDNYHKFMLKFVQIALNYLKNENINEIENDNNEINISYDKLMPKEMVRENNIYLKILELLKGNKENNIDVNDNEIKIIPNNINEIYEKCKSEIIFNEENKIIPEKKNISFKNIVKFFYYYTFGIVYQYNDKEMKLNECFILLKDILSQNYSISFCLMKKMEKNIEIFIDLFFKFGFVDKDHTGINKTISDFYQLLFMSYENYEKENYGKINNEMFYYFTKDNNGNCKFEKDYKSLYLRMFNKLLCKNLEKCRKEFMREKIFLELFNYIVTLSPESAFVSSNYLISLISFISNNNIPNLKSDINPNFKMGNNNAQYMPNPIYLNAFCKIIFSCVTPGMLKSKKKSPYYHPFIQLPNENINFNNLPVLPENWTRMFDSFFFINYFLYSKNDDVFKVLCHISFQDEIVTSQVMFNLKSILKNEFYYCTQFEEIILKAFEVLDLNDGLNQLRLNSFFEFNKDDEDNTLNKFFYDKKNMLPKISLRGIFLLSQLMERYQIVEKYIMEYKNKIKWINDFYAEVIVNVEEKNSQYSGVKNLIDENPGMLEYIQKEIINKFE